MDSPIWKCSAHKESEIDYLALQENNQEFAYVIGETYLATGDENYMIDYPASSLSKN